MELEIIRDDIQRLVWDIPRRRGKSPIRRGAAGRVLNNELNRENGAEPCQRRVVLALMSRAATNSSQRPRRSLEGRWYGCDARSSERAVGSATASLTSQLPKVVTPLRPQGPKIPTGRPSPIFCQSVRRQEVARASRNSRSRALRVRDAARSNSARASSRRPNLARRSPRTLGRGW